MTKGIWPSLLGSRNVKTKFLVFSVSAVVLEHTVEKETPSLTDVKANVRF